MKWLHLDLFNICNSEYIEDNKSSSIEGKITSIFLILISIAIWIIMDIEYLTKNKLGYYHEENILDYNHLKSIDDDYSSITMNNLNNIDLNLLLEVEFIQIYNSNQTDNNAFQIDFNNKYEKSITLSLNSSIFTSVNEHFDNELNYLERSSVEINLTNLILETDIINENNISTNNKNNNINSINDLNLNSLKKFNNSALIDNYKDSISYKNNKTVLTMEFNNNENNENLVETFFVYNNNYFNLKTSNMKQKQRFVPVHSNYINENSKLDLIITPVIIKTDNCIFTTCFKNVISFIIHEEKTYFSSNSNMNKNISSNVEIRFNTEYLVKIITFVEFRVKLHTIIFDFVLILIILHYIIRLFIVKILRLNFYLELINKFINFSDLNEERRVKYFSNNNQITILQKNDKKG